MSEPVLWLGFIMAAGALGAMAARAARLPAISGALVGGLAVSLLATAVSAQRPDLRYADYLLVAFLCFMAGADIDLTHLARNRRSILAGVMAQTVLVTALVMLAALALRFDLRAALAIGVCLSAGSPAVVFAVSTELRAHGDLSQRLLCLSSLSLLPALAVLLFMRDMALPSGAALLLVEAAVAAAIGLVILIPVSRMSLRGAIVAAALAGSVIVALTQRWEVSPRPADLAILTILAGFLVATLSANRDVVRSALRDVAPACAVMVFALVGWYLTADELAAGVAGGLLLLAARIVGLLLAGLMAAGRRDALAEALGQIPMGGLTGSGLVMLMLFNGGAPERYQIPHVAIWLSGLVGAVTTRWALGRAGEAGAAEEDPDAWRAAMR